MNLLLDSTAIGWSLFALFGGISLLIYYLRSRFTKMSEKGNFTQKETTIKSRNKYSEINAFKWSGTFLRIGLMMSLAFVVLAFNYTTFEEVKFEIGQPEAEEIIENDTPRTKDRPKPPPPPPPPPVKIEIPDEPIEDTIAFVDQHLDVEEAVIASPLPEPKAVITPKPTLPTPPDPDEGGTVRIFAEQMPRFPGCNNISGDKKAKDQCATNKLLKFLSNKLVYPSLARENGIYGTAVIRFVVEKDGTLSGLEIVKDPGGGLGKEALRVINLMNNMKERWSPGKQNAHPVRVQFNLPIRFELQ